MLEYMLETMALSWTTWLFFYVPVSGRLVNENMWASCTEPQLLHGNQGGSHVARNLKKRANSQGLDPSGAAVSLFTHWP